MHSARDKLVSGYVDLSDGVFAKRDYRLPGTASSLEASGQCGTFKVERCRSTSQRMEHYTPFKKIVGTGSDRFGGHQWVYTCTHEAQGLRSQWTRCVKMTKATKVVGHDKSTAHPHVIVLSDILGYPFWDHFRFSVLQRGPLWCKSTQSQI